ncbi:hypothetical protein GCM10027287_46080 [Bordetella muralis]
MQAIVFIRGSGTFDVLYMEPSTCVKVDTSTLGYLIEMQWSCSGFVCRGVSDHMSDPTHAQTR